MQDWLPDEVQAARVLLLAELLEDVAALGVEDAHGLGKVVALHHAALAGVEAGQHAVAGDLENIEESAGSMAIALGVGRHDKLSWRLLAPDCLRRRFSEF